MNAKEWLSLYPALFSEREHLYDRLDELERDPQSVVPTELNYIEQRIKEIPAAMDEIWAAVCGLENAVESLVLQLRYLEPQGTRLMKWKDVARRIYKSDAPKNVRAAERCHNRALEHIQVPEVI